MGDNRRKGMTTEEKKQRRRELEQNPFHHALTLKTARAWRERNRDKINARRRERHASDPEFRAAENARQKRYRAANPDAQKKAWKKWADKNRQRLHERDRVRYQSEHGQALYKAKLSRARERYATDEAYRAHRRELNRLRENQRMDALRRDPAKWTAWRIKHWWRPRWEKAVADGPEAIARYLKRARPDARREFTKWYSARLIDRRSGLGRILQAADEVAPEKSEKSFRRPFTTERKKSIIQTVGPPRPQSKAKQRRQT